MNLASVQAIEGEVLYQGFTLYPYRRRQPGRRRRWSFGPLFPRAYARQHHAELCCQQIQCLVDGGPATRVELRVGFLHLVQRQPGRFERPLFALPFREPAWTPVERLVLGGRDHRRGQEALEREVSLPVTTLDELMQDGVTRRFDYPAARELEGLRERPGGDVVGVLVRSRERLAGVVRACATRLAENLYRVTVVVENVSPADADGWSLDAASRRSLASAHTVLGVTGGRLVSLIDPPPARAAAAAACVNRGCFPVLVGDPERCDTLLASPVILHDFPDARA